MPAEKGSRIRLDELTSKIVGDPNSPSEAQLVIGFLGESSEPDHTRIYWDAALSSYIDAATTDILHSEALPKELSPLGGSYIWLRREASVFFSGITSERRKAKFLEGPLAAAYGAMAGQGAVTARLGAVPAAAPGVRQTIADPWCPYPSEICTFAGPCRQATPAAIRQTVADPWCPYPSEICTFAGPCQGTRGWCY